MNNPSSPLSPVPPASPMPSEDQIAQRAREIWLGRGQPFGQDVEIWFEAERQLREPVAVLAPAASVAPVLPPTTPPVTSEAPADTALEAGETGLRRVKKKGRTLSEKVETALRPGGYGEGGHQRLGGNT